MAKGSKTGGRKKGTPNRITKELRTILKNLIHDELEGLPKQLNKLEPKERLEIIIKLIPYALPKVSQVDYSTHEPLSFDWD